MPAVSSAMAVGWSPAAVNSVLQGEALAAFQLGAGFHIGAGACRTGWFMGGDSFSQITD
jgi:hypothetical protein